MEYLWGDIIVFFALLVAVVVPTFWGVTVPQSERRASKAVHYGTGQPLRITVGSLLITLAETGVLFILWIALLH